VAVGLRAPVVGVTVRSERQERMDQCGGKDEYQLPEATDERGYKKCNGEQGGEEECGEMRSC